MVQHKIARSWFSRSLLLTASTAAFLLPLAADRIAIGSPRGSGASKGVRLPIEDAMTLKCETTTFTSTTGDSRGISSEATPSTGELTFTAVNGQFALVGPLGTDELRLMSTSITHGSMFFEYLAPNHNAQMWTFHRLKDGRILFSGQYSMDTSLGTDERIVIMTQAGYCRATGGNGLPIRR